MWPSASRSSRRLCSAGGEQVSAARAPPRPARARLTLAQVRVDAHVARRARQALVLAVRDVLLGLGVDVLLGQAEVDDVDGVLPLGARAPHQEVLGLHVPVDEALGVDVLHARDQLDGDHEHRLECERAITQVKQVLQARPEQLQHHGIVLPTRAEVVDLRDALCGAELLVEAVLQVQLRGPGLDGLQFNSYVFICIEILP